MERSQYWPREHPLGLLAANPQSVLKSDNPRSLVGFAGELRANLIVLEARHDGTRYAHLGRGVVGQVPMKTERPVPTSLCRAEAVSDGPLRG